MPRPALSAGNTLLAHVKVQVTAGIAIRPNGSVNLLETSLRDALDRSQLGNLLAARCTPSWQTMSGPANH